MIARGLLLLVIALLVGCGEEERPKVRAGDPFEAVDPTAVLRPEDLHKAAPRWEGRTSIRGEGGGRHTIDIDGSAIQWRLRWRCEASGRLRIAEAGARPGTAPLLDRRCPGRGDAASVTSGRVDLDVRAEGPWSARVEQQVDTPLREPPLPAMTAPGARVIRRGAMERMERQGEGRIELHRLPNRRLALRFDSLETTASTDLEIWISPERRPRTSAAAVRSKHVSIGPLKSTAGTQNYVLPPGTRARDVRSVVLWCEPLYVAYASAELR